MTRHLAFALAFAAVAAACSPKGSEPAPANPTTQSARAPAPQEAKCPATRAVAGYDWSRPTEKWWTLGDAACPDKGKLQESEQDGAKVHKCMLGDTAHGPEVSWFPDGTTKRWEGYYLFGNQHGLWRGWYENGNQYVEMGYRNGVPHGPYIEWYEDGKVSSEGEYNAGNRTGLWLDHWPTGKVRVRMTLKNSQYDGSYEEFYEDGSKRLTASYTDGAVDGKVVRYSTAGVEIGSFEMKKGTGVWREWHDNGTLALEQEQTEMRPSGAHVRYHENGKKAEEGRYKNGSGEGVWRYWNEAGDLIMQQEFEGNNTARSIQYEAGKVSRIDDFYVSGYRKSSIGYDGDKKKGLATTWHDGTGKMETRGSYEKDKKEGRWLVWNRTGELLAVENYRKGKLGKKEKPKPITIAPDYATGEPLCDLMIEEVITCTNIPREKLDMLKAYIGSWKERLAPNLRDWSQQDVQAECEQTRTDFREVRETAGCR